VWNTTISAEADALAHDLDHRADDHHAHAERGGGQERGRRGGRETGRGGHGFRDGDIVRGPSGEREEQSTTNEEQLFHAI